MKFLIMLMLVGASLGAAAQMSSADAFNAGKDFANGAKGAAAGSVNTSTGQSKLPYYSSSAPESQNYQSGRNPITGAGQSKMRSCATMTSPNGFKQQECDAVNFLAKNSTSRPKYVIDKTKDPIITGSKNVIANPGSIPGASTQQCRVEKIKNPATYINETCTQTMTTETLTCDEKQMSCSVTGKTLQCTPVSMSCTGGSPNGCCNIYITCYGAASLITYKDCCGATYTNTATSPTQFLSGVNYNPAGAKLVCDSSGNCSITFENYYCSSPWYSFQSYGVIGRFTLASKPVFSCLPGGGCESLEARTK